ncbi:MAG: cupin domain-containing protein [Armatimonadota bacterium]
MKEPVIRHLDDVEAVPCPCGDSSRLITAAEGSPVSVHVTHFEDGDEHFHELTDEVYYIIEGQGTIELDGVPEKVIPDTAVFIPAGVAHRGYGDFTAIVIARPPFNPDDEISTHAPGETTES